MPFGGVLFTDDHAPLRCQESGQAVTSAFRRSAVRGPSKKLLAQVATFLSPVPFGGVLFADKKQFAEVNVSEGVSPVPFGGVLFADLSTASRKTPRALGSSPVPFGGVLFADLAFARDDLRAAECCSRTAKKFFRWSKSSPSLSHQCLSAECCSRTIGELEVFRQVIESPVPFGGVLFADVLKRARKVKLVASHQCLSAECCSRTQLRAEAARLIAVTSAFRRSAVRGPRKRIGQRRTRGKVTSAFRRSAVRGPRELLRAVELRDSITSPVPFGGVLFADGRVLLLGVTVSKSGHQCLSAECCSRTDYYTHESSGGDNMSPVPFGGVLFADWTAPTRSLREKPVSHQCLSAECCSRTLAKGWRLSASDSPSPVPFGGVLFADARAKLAKDRVRFGSPVPFGGVLFADLARRSSFPWRIPRVSPVPFGGVLFADPRS